MSVVTAADVEQARDVLIVDTRDVITPLARDRAKELGIRLERSSKPAAGRATGGPPARVPAGELPPAVARATQRSSTPQAPRSGALYRRGGYGLDGRRSARANERVVINSLGRPTIAVVGAGHVGAATGMRLAESDAFERLTLIDVVDGLAAGLALDMWHSAGLRGFTTRVTGSADIDAVDGADIVVVTAGRPRTPDMTRTDLTAANAAIIRIVAKAIRERAPAAVVVVVTNPVEEMTALMNELTGFPPERVIGMGGVLDTARFRSLVGLTGVARPEDVAAIVLGSHGAEMVVPLSQARANGIPLEDALDAATLSEIVARTRDSGAEVTRLLKAGSAFVSPGCAIANQIAAIVRGSDDVLPACVAARGAYGLGDVRIGLPVRLGPGGVREIVALELRPEELQALRAAATAIRARTQLLALS